MESPDMMAFTFGRVTLHLLSEGTDLTKEALTEQLKKIVKCDTEHRVTPKMANNALRLLRETSSHTAA